jgi:hypothetical protein
MLLANHRAATKTTATKRSEKASDFAAELHRICQKPKLYSIKDCFSMK